MRQITKGLFLFIILTSFSTWGFAFDTKSSGRTSGDGYVTGQGIQSSLGKKKPAGNNGSTPGSSFHRTVHRFLPGLNAPPGDFNDAPLQPTVKDNTQGAHRGVVQGGRGPRIVP